MGTAGSGQKQKNGGMNPKELWGSSSWSLWGWSHGLHLVLQHPGLSLIRLQALDALTWLGKAGAPCSATAGAQRLKVETHKPTLGWNMSWVFARLPAAFLAQSSIAPSGQETANSNQTTRSRHQLSPSWLVHSPALSREALGPPCTRGWVPALLPGAADLLDPSAEPSAPSYPPTRRSLFKYPLWLKTQKLLQEL